ncbi:MAG: hydrogenase maturation nickel metallochaperone HypA [Candidatus Omnitrophica bacterium]|nr:hydrogenase maturation nickel metallochaperone HypA [Candidatus Omnitrophota bacterium]MBU4141110.1 hydrogenase maturation nickel metallochaperone HypA [Candidatus Omnitrophota bacterium]
MHESHLIEPVIKGISAHARKEGAKSISKVRLKVGTLTGVKEDSLKETFAVLAKGTILENAGVEITFFPGSRIEVISFDVE